MVLKPETLKSKRIDSFAPNLSGQDNGRLFKRASWLHVLVAELTGELAVGVANATLLEDGILRLVKKLVFNLLGDVSPFSVSARLLHRINSYVNAAEKRISQPAVTFATSPNKFRLSMDMNFVMPDFYAAEGFKLNTQRFKGQEIGFPSFNVQLGTVADVATPGGGGTVALQNLLLNLHAKDENGEGIGLERENQIREELEFVTDAIVNTEQSGTFNIRDNNRLRRIAILARNNGTGLLSDAVIDEVQLVRNEDDVLRQWKWEDLQSKNKEEYQLTTELFNALKTGFAILNLDTEFDLSGVLDTRLDKGTKSLTLKTIPVGGQTALVSASREVILVKQ